MNKTKSILSKSHLEHFYLFYALFFPSVRTLTIVHMVWIVWLERGRWEIMRRKRKTNTNTQFRAWNSRCHSFIILYSSWQLLSLAITIFEFYSRFCCCCFVPLHYFYLRAGWSHLSFSGPFISKYHLSKCVRIQQTFSFTLHSEYAKIRHTFEPWSSKNRRLNHIIPHFMNGLSFSIWICIAH